MEQLPVRDRCQYAPQRRRQTRDLDLVRSTRRYARNVLDAAEAIREGGAGMSLTRRELKAAVAGTPAEKAVAAQLGEHAPGPKPSKYHNEPVYVDGIRFASKREARRFWALKVLMQAGEVMWFTRQGRFALPGGVEYVEDFCVQWQGGEVIHEDVKGVRTKEYRLKKRQVEALYRVKIVEV